MTALIQAAIGGHTAIVDLLLTKRPDLNVGAFNEKYRHSVILRLSHVLSHVFDDNLDLTDEAGYAEVVDEVTKQWASFGTVVAVEIPRPDAAGAAEGLGCVFVRFSTEEEAQAARQEAQV